MVLTLVLSSELRFLLKASVDMSTLPPAKGPFRLESFQCLCFSLYLLLRIAFYGNHFTMLRSSAAEKLIIFTNLCSNQKVKENKTKTYLVIL